MPNGAYPCDCQASTQGGAFDLPPVGAIRAALHLAGSAPILENQVESMEFLGSPAIAPTIQIAPPNQVAPYLGNSAPSTSEPSLETLLALARAHPGLKITLSY